MQDRSSIIDKQRSGRLKSLRAIKPSAEEPHVVVLPGIMAADWLRGIFGGEAAPLRAIDLEHHLKMQ